MDDASQALLEAEAAARGVSLGGLIRESAVRAARDVGREVSAGRIKLRGRSAGVPVPRAGRDISGGEERVPVIQPAVAQSGGGKPLPAPVPVDPGVARAAAFRRAAMRA